MTNRLTELADRVEQARVDEQRAMLLAAFELCFPENYMDGRSGFNPFRWERFKRLLEAGAFLDAAMTLVLEGWFPTSLKQTTTYERRTFTAEDDTPLPEWTAQLIPEGANPDKLAWRDRANGEGATPALALTTAALRSRAAQGDE